MINFLKKTILTFILSIFAVIFSLEQAYSKAANAPVTESTITSSGQIKEPGEFQKIVDEYKEHVSKIPVEIRDEVVTYRKEIAKINKQKRQLYRKLSQEAQNFLKTEQSFKKRLPMNRKSLIKLNKKVDNKAN